MNVNSMKLMMTTVQCNYNALSSLLLLLYVTDCPVLPCDRSDMSWHSDVTLRLISSKFMWKTPGYIECSGKSVKTCLFQKIRNNWWAGEAERGTWRREILRNLFKALNLPKIDCSPSLARRMSWVASQFVSSHCTKSRQIAMRLTSLMHWGAGEWAGMQASWCIILARWTRCSSRFSPSVIGGRVSSRITFIWFRELAILCREKR